MNRLSQIFLSLCLVSLGACSSTAVSTQWDHDIRFKERKTFCFAPGLRKKAAANATAAGGATSNPTDPQGDDQALLINSIVRKDLREGIAAELTAKGFKEVKTGGDLTVAYYLNAKRRESVHKSEPQIGWDYGYGVDEGYGYGFEDDRPEWDYGYSFAPVAESPTLDVREYEEGTVIIDMYDANTKRLICRGRGIREIANTQDANSFKVKQTAAKILAKFPPS